MDPRERELRQAITGGDAGLVARLLGEGVDANARIQKTRYTALHLAAEHARPAIVRLLLDAGAAPNAQSKAGQTPLMLSALSQDLGSVRLLLPVSDLGLRASRGLTALFIAQSIHPLRPISAQKISAEIAELIVREPERRGAMALAQAQAQALREELDAGKARAPKMRV